MGHVMKVNLGVVDQKYGGVKQTASGKRISGSKLTTGDVAKILESKYGILGAFVDKHAKDIQSSLETSFVRAFEEMAKGLPSRSVYGSAEQDIQVLMKRWLSTREVERVGLKGVPTKAALDGVSSRSASGLKGVSMAQFKKGVRKGKRRPSFIDTGLMQASYKAWVE